MDKYYQSLTRVLLESMALCSYVCVQSMDIRLLKYRLSMIGGGVRVVRDYVGGRVVSSSECYQIRWYSARGRL